MSPWLLLGFVLLQTGATPAAPGPFVQALQIVQAFGTVDAAAPENDRALKAALAKALATDKTFTADEVKELMKPDVFAKLAGDDRVIKADELTEILKHAAPQSRLALLPQVRDHATYLATTFDMLGESQLQASRQLADWLAKNYDSSKTLHVIVVCTGNSRRSMLGACMGNMAAAYYGLDKVRFHSGGTAPTAFNKRTIATLKAIGFEISPTGEEAERGEPKTGNAKYRVVWGTGMESIEYSKRYSDASNPVSGFAAVMVCTEADSECPNVQGAAFRLSMPFLDPKSYDDGQYETVKYAERRDDIGRVLMATMAIVSRKLQK